MTKKTKFISLIACASLTASLFPYPLIGAQAYSQSAAQTYLLAHASNPWATMGLSALGAANIPSDYLKNVSGSSAIDFEAPTLAITSLGQDPKTFGSTNLTDKIKSFYTGGQIGDPTALNDDIFGILALESAGLPLTDAAIDGSKSFLIAHQNPDGGWGFAVGSGSDSNTTASAVVALIAAGTSASDSHIQNALAYLKTAQNDDGGFTYDPKSSFGTASDSSSTAWVMWALTSTGASMSSWTKAGHTPADYLSSNQIAAGFFAFQSGSPEDSFSPVTTAYAAIALAGKTLPLKTGANTVLAPNVNFRIEGSTGNVCAGSVNATTALDVITNSSSACGFTFNIKNSSFGQYLNQINADTAAGLTGWIYTVNNVEPSVGAADYQLKTNDDVLWFFGDYTWQPTRLSLSAAQIDAGSASAQIGTGQSVTATVENFANGSWSALSGAAVYAGVQTAQTDNAGKATLSLPDGFYKVYASKNGFVRSNQVLLKVGQPSSSQLELSANFSGGQVNGTSTPNQLPSTLSFTVDSTSLDFGNVAPGSQKSKTLTIKNNSSSGINLAASVSGDPLFTNNLSLNNSFWQNFAAAVATGQSQAVTAGLNIPNTFTGGAGAKTGQMIIWATTQ